MSLTPLTLLIIFVMAPMIIFGSFSGHKKGFYKSSVIFVSLMLSVFIGALISSNFLGPWISDMIWESVLSSALEDVCADIPELREIFVCLITTVISPFAFVPVFLLIYAVLKIIVRIVFAATANPDSLGSECSNEGGSWFRKNSRYIGSVIGGICGFISALAILTPFVGTVKNANSVIGIVKDTAGFSADDETLEIFKIADDYANDIGATVIYHMGGSVVYNLSARAELRGHAVVLTKEVAAIEKIAEEKPDFAALSDFVSISEENLTKIENMCLHVGNSYFLSYTVSSVISELCDLWSNNEAAVGLAPPIMAPAVEPMLTPTMNVLSETTPETVTEDILTFVEVCRVIQESNILDAEGSYDRLTSVLEDGRFMDKLIEVLEKNPRMAPVLDSLHVIATRALVDRIKTDGYSETQYNKLTENIAEKFNKLSDLPTQTKLETLTEHAVELIEDYGVEVPESMAKVVVEAMIREIKPDKSGLITSRQVKGFLDKYQSSTEEK